MACKPTKQVVHLVEIQPRSERLKPGPTGRCSPDVEGRDVRRGATGRTSAGGASPVDHRVDDQLYIRPAAGELMGFSELTNDTPECGAIEAATVPPLS